MSITLTEFLEELKCYIEIKYLQIASSGFVYNLGKGDALLMVLLYISKFESELAAKRG